MRIVTALILLVILASFSLIGGFSFPYDTTTSTPTPTPKAYYSVSDMAREAGKTLQLYTLISGVPLPTVSQPTPTQPPGITPAPTTPLSTPRPTPTNYPACTNFSCSACQNNGIKTCTATGPAPCTPQQTTQSCTPPSPTSSCASPTDACALAIPGCRCDVHTLITCGTVNGQPRCISRKDDQGNTLECREFDHNHCRGCQSSSGPGTYCFAKPVIYLYPQKPMHVNVEVQTTGSIVVSDPLYPPGGWKDVTAHPDGSLFYQGAWYRELFYETDVTDFAKPTTGIIIPITEIHKRLENYITLLGLTKSDERAEFLEFWIPRLKDLHAPYIQFSVLDPKEKAKTDKVIITPKPDTFIEFIAYFKPLPKPIAIPPLQLPTTPPTRSGFTAVEWGGVVDDKELVKLQ